MNDKRVNPVDVIAAVVIVCWLGWQFRPRRRCWSTGYAEGYVEGWAAGNTARIRGSLI